MNNIEQFEDKKAALMYFHTSLRNVGLFTTLSFGALGYSRYYRDKIQFYNLILILYCSCFAFHCVFIELLST